MTRPVRSSRQLEEVVVVAAGLVAGERDPERVETPPAQLALGQQPLLDVPRDAERVLLARQPRELDGERDLLREGLEQAPVRLAELAGAEAAVHVKHADGLALDQERRAHQRPYALHQHGLGQVESLGAHPADVADGLARAHDLAGPRAAVRGVERQVLSATSPRDADLELALPVLQEEHPPLGPAQGQGTVHGGVEQRGRRVARAQLRDGAQKKLEIAPMLPRAAGDQPQEAVGQSAIAPSLRVRHGSVPHQGHPDCREVSTSAEPRPVTLPES
jgi:hypothetical protein